MTAKTIDGNAIAEEMRGEIAQEVERLKTKYGVTPGLATVLIGESPASQMYVRMKQRTCEKVGIKSYGYELPGNVSQEEAEKLVRGLSGDPKIHGILVQLPLPKPLDEEGVLSAVALEKDVDGFHPVNIGRLAMKGRDPLFIPCTPYGCMVLLEKAGAKFEGAEAVVLGRSNIVGLPVALLLLHANATVTICHSRTKNLPEVCRKGDILVAAVGRAEMVRKDWVKPGAYVIDVGSNKVEDPTAEKGYRWVGDVAFDEVKEVAGAITPSPGGVGPMTITVLLKNTLTACKRAVGEG